MFSKILVAVDGSESADKAFDRAVFLAARCGSMLDLVHVVQCEVGGDSANTFEIIEQLKEKAMNMLDRYKALAQKNGVPIQVTIMQGDPAKVIIETAREKSYDLIIMGTRGRSAFKELLIGSVSQKVMHHANCPVMVVR